MPSLMPCTCEVRAYLFSNFGSGESSQKYCYCHCYWRKKFKFNFSVVVKARYYFWWSFLWKFGEQGITLSHLHRSSEYSSVFSFYRGAKRFENGLVIFRVNWKITGSFGSNKDYCSHLNNILNCKIESPSNRLWFSNGS